MRRILITGGAGFIGVNTANYYLEKGSEVIILDNFSRRGSKENIAWLNSQFTKKPEVVVMDLRHDLDILEKVVRRADVVFHFAGQVAVTRSVANPRDDFENNTLATFNVLEAARKAGHNPIVVYSSTNKVYGSLEHIPVRETDTRFEFINLPFGIAETEPLDFHSPYGCSKGAADQYVRDYYRIYGLPTIVFRQSCIYGTRQFGIEDQGWVAWFLIALIKKKQITIYGSGKQVRDLLYIDDLLDAYDRAINNIDNTKGNIYNIGGGHTNTISVWKELHPILENLLKTTIKPVFAKERPGDQPLFISDIRKAKTSLDWEPRVTVKDGIERLYRWVKENQDIFKNV